MAIMVILLMDIGGYFINGSCGYSINGYWWLFYEWLLVVIILMVISSYFIAGYWWLFY